MGSCVESKILVPSLDLDLYAGSDVSLHFLSAYSWFENVFEECAQRCNIFLAIMWC